MTTNERMGGGWPVDDESPAPEEVVDCLARVYEERMGLAPLPRTNEEEAP